MHGSQTQNLGPLHVAELASNNTWRVSVDMRRPKRQRMRTIQSRADRLSSLVDENAGVVVKLDNTAVRSLVLLCGTDDNGVSDITTADFVGGTDGYAASGAGFGTKVALLLNDDDDAVA
jgi:hypothetical protein